VILECGQQGDQGVGEVGQLVGRVSLQDAEIDEETHDRFACPIVGAAQHPGLQDP
jgi:hypothetical protein